MNKQAPKFVPDDSVLLKINREQDRVVFHFDGWFQNEWVSDEWPGGSCAPVIMEFSGVKPFVFGLKKHVLVMHFELIVDGIQSPQQDFSVPFSLHGNMSVYFGGLVGKSNDSWDIEFQANALDITIENSVNVNA